MTKHSTGPTTCGTPPTDNFGWGTHHWHGWNFPRLCCSLNLFLHDPTSFPSPSLVWGIPHPAHILSPLSFIGICPFKIFFLFNHILACASQRSQTNILGLLPYSWVIPSSPHTHNYALTPCGSIIRSPLYKLKNHLCFFYMLFLRVKISRVTMVFILLFPRVTCGIISKKSSLDTGGRTAMKDLHCARVFFRTLVGSFSEATPVCPFHPLTLHINTYCPPKSAALIAIIGRIGPEFKERIIPVQILIKMGSLSLSWKD